MPADFPEWIEPMAATLTQERFTGPDWTFERKFDGIRLIAFRARRGRPALLAQHDSRSTMPAVAAAIASLPVHDVILDGEMTWDRRQSPITSSTSSGSTVAIS